MLALLAVLPLALGPSAPFANGSYEFTCDYETLDVKGQVSKVDRIQANLKVEDGRLTWSGAQILHGSSRRQWRTSLPQKDLEGFTYGLRDSLFKPSRFQGFTDPEYKLRNLLWDTEMFREFGSDLPKMKTGKPLHLKPSNVPLGGGSTFKNTDIQLSVADQESTGPVIGYMAPGNKIDMKLENGMTLDAVSKYYGKIWLRKGDHTILKATLEEDVAGTVRHTPAGDLPVHVVREGVFKFVSSTSPG